MSTQERAERMLTWLKKNGGHVHPSAELRNDPTVGLSLFATGPIAIDDRLVSCPFAVAITPGLSTRVVAAVTGVPAEDLLWPAGSDKAGEPWNERMRTAAYIGLHWVWDDREKAGGGKARPTELAHAAYIEALPRPADLTTPLYFSAEERALLSGTNLVGAIADREREWKSESAAVRSVLKEEGLTWYRYLAVATYLSSRAFPSRLLKLPDGESDAAPPGSQDSGSHPVLLPGVDMLNHARGHPILWLSSRVTSPEVTETVPAISLMAAQSAEAGAELFNNYGAKPNEELLLGYGFVIPDNPDDTVVLRLGAASMPDDVAKRLAAKGLDATQRFAVGRDGELPRELLEVVRTMMGSEGDDDVDEEDEHAEHEAEERGLNLELDVLGMLGGMLEDKLAKIKAGSREGQVEGVRKGVAQMCAVYRKGQAEILDAAMDKLSDRVERIESLLDESPGCGCGC